MNMKSGISFVVPQGGKARGRSIRRLTGRGLLATSRSASTHSFIAWGDYAPQHRHASQHEVRSSFSRLWAGDRFKTALASNSVKVKMGSRDLPVSPYRQSVANFVASREAYGVVTSAGRRSICPLRVLTAQLDLGGPDCAGGRAA